MNPRITLMLTGMTLLGLAMLVIFATSIPIGVSAAAPAKCTWPGGCVTIKGITYPAPRMAGIPGTTLGLAKPNCAGPPGTTIYIVVISKLKSPLTAVTFKRGPFGLAKSQGSSFNVPSANFLTEVMVGCPETVGFCLNAGSGNGMSLFSVYSWTTTVSLCTPGVGTWYWDMFPFFAGVQGIDIAEFTANC
jgi:hypothetical protein